MNNVVWDIEKGTILRLGPGGKILHAVIGYEKLSDDHIRDVYGNNPVYKHLKWPETNKQLEEAAGAHWVLFSYWESLTVPLICHIVNLITKGLLPGKSVLDFAFDLLEETNRQLNSGTNNSKVFNAL